MGLYLSSEQWVRILKETDEFTDFSFEENEPKTTDLMFSMGVISGRLELLANLLGDKYTDEG